MGLGWTIGEEILYGSRSDEAPLVRHESCIVRSAETCLIQLTVDDLVTMSSQRAAIGGGGMLTKDYDVLLSFLEKNFEVKNNWRKRSGVIENRESSLDVN